MQKARRYLIKTRKNALTKSANQFKISKCILLVSILSNLLFWFFGYIESAVGGHCRLRAIAILALVINFISLIMLIIFLVKKRYITLKKWQQTILWLYAVANALYMIFVLIVVAILIISAGNFVDLNMM